jgi:FtsZ-binding cell division protein ZapB
VKAENRSQGKAEKEKTMNSYESMYNSICEMLHCDFGKAYGTIEAMQKQIAELQGKLDNETYRANDNQLKLDNMRECYERQVKEKHDLKDKLHRRNLQIAELKKDRVELFRLSALLGRLGYDLKGNKSV